MEKLISVIIPVYNVEKYLDKCIDSIINQTYSNLEIILIDDGSTDNSGKICDKYALLDSRIKVIHKKNGGLSDARNVGIDNANGKYLMFVDSDDFIDYNTICDNINIMKENKADIIIYNRYYVYDDGKKFLRFPILNSILEFTGLEAIEEMNSFKNFDMSAWGKIYKKDLFKCIRFPVGKTSEDFYIMFLLLEKSKKVIYNSKPYYFYIQRAGSISKRKIINYDFLDAARKQMNYLEKKYKNLKKCARTAYASAAITIYNIVLGNDGICEKKDLIYLQNIVKENYSFIKENDNISRIKKIQIYLFQKNIILYNFLFKLLRKVKRV